MKKLLPDMARSLRLGIVIAAIAGLATAAMFWRHVQSERRLGLEDLERRASLLAHRMAPEAAEAMGLSDAELQKVMKQRLEGYGRLMGAALLRPDGKVAAAGQWLSDLDPVVVETAAKSTASGEPESAVGPGAAGAVHALAWPLKAEDGRVVGALAVVHDVDYLDERATRGMVHGVFWTLGVTIGMFFIASGAIWTVFERPLHRLADWMRQLRFGNVQKSPPRGLAVSKLADESEHLAASFRAARVREGEEARGIVRSDRAWTRDRLRAHAIDALGGKPLVVVSNREPYMHQFKNGKPQVVTPASGLVTGLDPVLRACGGLWVAHGAGDADRVTANASGSLPVPPDDPRYSLRRVWISKEEEQGYYYGFSNEGLWPLCHLTHERPVFRASDWEQYFRANRRFADAVLEEIGSERAVVMVQDYQLALVPGMIKAARPDLSVGLFWHIPWPNPEAFRICPYRVELLLGMLGADLVGFHLQQHCNNFLDTVDRMVEARLDWDRFSAEVKGHTALVRPFPISVQSWSERGVPEGEELTRRIQQLRETHGLASVRVGVGVDRVDYTKGIAERFRAIERLMEKYPEHRGTFTFVQLGAPSRTHIPRYRELMGELDTMADRINWKFQTETWKPILFLASHHDAQTVFPFMRMASVCIVSSLHDGMNLVAKEYVAAQAEGDPEADPGALVLSEFAGAARDLPEALIINPYDIEQFAEAINRALTMDPKEKEQRMTRMRLRVEENNIYRWAAEFLGELAQTARKAEQPVAQPA